MYYCRMPHRRIFLSSAVVHLGWFVQLTNTSIWIFSFHWHSPHRLTRLHKPTRPHGRFLSSVSACIDLIDYTDVFSLSQPTLAYSFKQTISSFYSSRRDINLSLWDCLTQTQESSIPFPALILSWVRTKTQRRNWYHLPNTVVRC